MTTARTGALRLSFLFGLLLAACTVSTAQPASPTPSAAVGEPKELGPTAKKGPEKKQKKVRINHADRARYDSARGMFYLFRNKTGSKGPIEFQDEDMKLICDEAIYDENDDTAACAGRLKITDEESVITGDHINADFDAEIARVEGNVKIVTTETIKKKKEGETEETEEKRVTTIWCDEIEYTYTDGARRAIAKGNLKAVQKDKTVRSPKANFDLEKDIVVLAAPVQVELENGSQFTTDGATISTAEDWMDTGQITGFFINDRDEEKEPTPEEGTGTETPPAEPPPAETPTPTPPAGEGGE